MCVAYMSYSVYSKNNSTSYIPLDQSVYKGFPSGATIIPIRQASTLLKMNSPNHQGFLFLAHRWQASQLLFRLAVFK